MFGWYVFPLSLYALPLSGYSRTILLRYQWIFKTHKVGASSFTIGTINQQVCYLRGITSDLASVVCSISRMAMQSDHDCKILCFFFAPFWRAG